MHARYDQIGKNYDKTRRADPHITQQLLSLLNPVKGKRYLDIACGSGNYTVALASSGVDIVGVDQSASMIEKARAKSQTIEWHVSDVTTLPFDNATFDGAICTLAIHHFDDLEAAFSEMRRVLCDGRLVIFSATREQMRGYWLNEYFPVAMERSIEQMPDLPEVNAALTRAGFNSIDTVPYFVQPDLKDFFLYAGKHRPEMYVDAMVRAGISTFSLLADADEVATGCERLARDIESGCIKTVFRQSEYEIGDYLFIVAEASDKSESDL